MDKTLKIMKALALGMAGLLVLPALIAGLANQLVLFAILLSNAVGAVALYCIFDFGERWDSPARAPARFDALHREEVVKRLGTVRV